MTRDRRTARHYAGNLFILHRGKRIETFCKGRAHPVCHTLRGRTTERREDVTCKRCLRLIELHDATEKSQREANLERARKDVALGVKPLAEAKCDECDEHAYTRWYGNHGTRAEYVAYTLCFKHNDEMIAENARRRKELGLDGTGEESS